MKFKSGFQDVQDQYEKFLEIYFLKKVMVNNNEIDKINNF